MPTRPFLWVDVFSNRQFFGNPCAVVVCEESFPSVEFMQSLAREMNLSETAFIKRDSADNFSARYFTPSQEIPMAGHPTLACAQALFDLGLFPESGAMSLNLPGAKVSVSLDMVDGHPTYTMLQPPGQFLGLIHDSELLEACGLCKNDLMPGYAPEIVSTGTPMLMVSLTRREVLNETRCNPQALGCMSQKYGFFSVHLFHFEASLQNTCARHFGHDGEDPFTGSATGCMAAWLHYHGLIAENTWYSALQGQFLNRPGKAEFQVITSQGVVSHVALRGQCRTLIQGTINI